MLARRRMSLRASTEDTGGRPMGNVRVIDGDGHIFEDAEAISSYLPSPYREAGPYPMTKLIPAVDHLHTQIGKLLPGAFAGGKHVGPEEWMEFMAEVGIESTVLYPTSALGYGRMVDLDWSIVVCRAYNDWLSATYVRRDRRFHGMALVPLQEPSEAGKELRRAVTELGLSGAFLPSNGLPLPLGAKPFWPLYAEAEQLGCALAVHGGNHSGYGMDHFKAGRIFIGCEGEEPDMPYLIQRVGVELFFFSSDYPHEVDVPMCQHEIEEVLHTPQLTDEHKAAI